MPKIPTLIDALDIINARLPHTVHETGPIRMAQQEIDEAWPFRKPLPAHAQAAYDDCAARILSDTANLMVFTATERQKIRRRISSPEKRKGAAMPAGRPRGGGRTPRGTRGPYSDRISMRARELVSWIGGAKVEEILEAYKAGGTVAREATSSLLTDEAARMAAQLGKHVTEKVLEHYCATGFVPLPQEIGERMG